MNLDKYLNSFFPNLKLQKPLFYNWKYGLRFEVGLESMPTTKDREKNIINLEYIETALARATELFEYTFEDNDDIIIVCQLFSLNRHKIKKHSLCLLAINNLKSKKIESFKLRNLYEEDGYYTKSQHWHRVTVSLKTKEVNYKKIFKRLIYSDFGFYCPEVYFINKSKNIIFDLYDDRGLDIIASNKKDLESTYIKYNSWLLDYDRKKIETLFE